MLSKCCRALAVALILANAATADAVEPYQDYRKRIEAAQNMTALKNDLFGDSVSLYNGKTDFQVTDIDLGGNHGLPVRLQRRFSVELHLSGGSSFNANLEGAGGWEVDVPHISGVFSGGGSSWASTRCSSSMVPTWPVAFALTDIWQGNTIHIPGDGDRTMLGLESTTPRPNDGIVRKWTTAQRDSIDCIPMVAGLAGEGFRITTTNGVSYHFNHAVSRNVGTLRKTLGVSSSAVAGRTKIYVLATRVEDRFGNWVQYQYNANGHPTKIWSNDGREIVLTYSGNQLASASAHGRTWTYGYGTVGVQTRLISVTLPDGSTWGYGYSNGLDPYAADWDGNSTSDCSEQPPEVRADFTLTATHPSGANGSFVFSNKRHYRSGVHMNQCFRRVNNSGGNLPENSNYYELGTPNFFDVMSLSKKTISGPGIPAPMTWTYAYGGGYQPLWGTYGSGGIYPCTTCVSEKLVVVTQPDQSKIQYRYGFQYALNEGKLLGSSTLNAAGTVLSTQATTYMTAAQVAGQPFAPRYGIIYNGDDPSSAQVLPETSSTILQDGTTFQKSVNSFDALARPLSVTRASPSFSRTDVTSYYDDNVRWILGQTASVTNTDTGLIVAQTGYDANAMPAEVRSFGKLQQTLTYDTASSVASGQRGTVKTVADGNSNVTTLSSWKRGVPQTIKHPATPEALSGAVQSAVVNDSGWITAITDENGYRTCYAHDAMGRISQVTYPSETIADTCNTTTWAPTTQVFQSVAATEYGIPAGHWRQTVSTGNARKITYFDALWRPVVTREYDTANEAGTKRFQRFDYDHDGRVTFASYPGTTDALSTGTWTTYDVLGRQRSVSLDSELSPSVLTTTTSYISSSTGGYTLVTTPAGQQTRTWFQAFDQPDYSTPIKITHPESASTHIERDIFGKPKQIRRSNSTSPSGGSVAINRDYTYNANQELCRVDEPEVGNTFFGYDGAGNVLWSAAGYNTTPGCRSVSAVATRRVDRSYDARNRVTSLSFPDGLGDTTHTYYPDGQPASIVANNGGTNIVTTEYTYNRRRLLTQERMLWSSINWPLTYGYNANGHLQSQVLPGGVTVGYAPNALGQPTQAGTYATGVSYYPNGAIKQFTYGNGVVHNMIQNARQLPERSYDCAVAGTGCASTNKRLDLNYVYDTIGNVSSITDNRNGRQTRNMAYDGLDRLTQTISPMFGTASYTYDALDNMTSINVSAGSSSRTQSYVYNPQNQLSNITEGNASVIALEYDPQGNVDIKTGKGQYLDHDFDFGNRLRSVAGKASYVYDGLGRRVRDYTTASKYSLYSQGGQLVYANDLRQSLATQYIYLGGSLVAFRETPSGGTAAVKYQHTDALGTPTAVTDATNAIIETYEYEPYGQLVNSTLKDGPGYTGHVQDAATGLTYMQQRYYDPQVGLFLSVDPVTALQDPVGSFNRYSYAGNSPINASDPDGRRCVTANSSSVYCMRRDIYRHFDRTVSSSTRFFGAAAATVEYLANGDIPGAGIAGNLGFGVSSEASSFLHGVSRALYSMNASTFSRIRDGSLSGTGLDAKLVRMEQTAVQSMLDGLPADQRDRIVGSINEAFQDRRLANWGSATDRAYNKVLDRVEKGLGRAVDFGKQSDREAIGNGLIRELRSSGACSSTGTRIKSC